MNLSQDDVFRQGLDQSVIQDLLRLRKGALDIERPSARAPALKEATFFEEQKSEDSGCEEEKYEERGFQSRGLVRMLSCAA